MSDLEVQVLTDREKLTEIRKMLKKMPNLVERAERYAGKPAARAMKAKSAPEIKKRYKLKSATIKKYEKRVDIRQIVSGGVTTEVNFVSERVPLYQFIGSSPKEPTTHSRWVWAMVKGKWTRVHPSIAAKGHQLNTTGAYKFSRAFVQQMPGSGHIGIFERNGKRTAAGSDAISELMGNSPSQMLGQENVKDAMTKLGQERFEKEFTKYINGKLRGYF